MDNIKSDLPMLRLALVFALAMAIFAAAPLLMPMKIDGSASIPVYHH